VPHDAYLEFGADRLEAMIAAGGVLVDLYAKVDAARLRTDIAYWSL
jgi:hypothetical protein